MKIDINIMLLTLVNERKCWKDYLNQVKYKDYEQVKYKDYEQFKKNWIRKQKLQKIL